MFVKLLLACVYFLKLCVQAGGGAWRGLENSRRCFKPSKKNQTFPQTKEGRNTKHIGEDEPGGKLWQVWDRARTANSPDEKVVGQGGASVNHQKVKLAIQLEPWRGSEKRKLFAAFIFHCLPGETLEGSEERRESEDGHIWWVFVIFSLFLYAYIYFLFNSFDSHTL